jgi:site-specific DNA recombinase
VCPQAPSLLAGLIVDADGHRLVATHATKQGKRYRYYISKAQHEGCRRRRLGRDHVMSLAADGGSVWRLPAAEIESIIMGEIRALLTDRLRLWEMVAQIRPERSWSMPEPSKLTRMAESLASTLAGDETAATRDTIITLVTAIELAPNRVTIVLSPEGLRTALGLDAGAHDPSSNDPPRLTIPVALRRRGVETELVLTQDGAPSAEPDPTMIRALARGRRWMVDLLDGVYGSVAALAPRLLMTPILSRSHPIRHGDLRHAAPVEHRPQPPPKHDERGSSRIGESRGPTTGRESGPANRRPEKTRSFVPG